MVVAGTHRRSEHSSEAPVSHAGSCLQNEDVFAPFGKLTGDGSAARAGTYDNDIEDSAHAPFGNRPIRGWVEPGALHSIVAGTCQIIGI